MIKTLLTITSVKAVPLKTRGFRIEATLANGEVIILKKKSIKAPAMVQLFDGHENGNAKVGSASALFTFAKSTKSSWNNKHIKTFIVEAG